MSGFGYINRMVDIKKKNQMM